MASMSPLASLMLLAFFLLIVLSLLVWALLGPRGVQAVPRRERRRADDPPTDGDRAPEPVRVPHVTNDELRGAKAAPKRPAAPDDAFERFLRSGRDDDR